MARKAKVLSKEEIKRREMIRAKSARDEKAMRDLGCFCSMNNGKSHTQMMREKR